MKTQLNTPHYKMVSPELINLGFVVKLHIQHSDFCLFGKSVPDVYFYKHGSVVVLAAVMSEEKTNTCIGAMAEFKQQDKDLKKHYAQAFTDMARVGTLSWVFSKSSKKGLYLMAMKEKMRWLVFMTMKNNLGNVLG